MYSKNPKENIKENNYNIFSSDDIKENNYNGAWVEDDIKENNYNGVWDDDDIWNEEAINVCSSAVNFLNFRRKGSRDAVIFDIDGTLVADERYCILPVKQLYYEALSKGYFVFIITARAKTLGNQIFTSMMLEKCGIEGYFSMFMRPVEDMDLFKYKEDRRKNIADMGYNSIMSVGDMPFDFGAYGGLSVKIPEINL